jgi:hypothetical protein
VKILKRQAPKSAAVFVCLLFGCLFWSGCATTDHGTGPKSAEARLTRDLQRLSPTIDPEEAHRLATTAIATSKQLAISYRSVSPAVLHNILVNTGLRERGFCYHWRNDLLRELRKLDLQTVVFHFGTARRGTEREHNCIVVTAQDQSFENGLVLDPWRYSGNLWWCLVREDKSHPWVLLDPDLIPHEFRAQPRG